MGTGSDVFVLAMGEPVRIADLAVRIVHLSRQEEGHQPRRRALSPSTMSAYA